MCDSPPEFVHICQHLHFSPFVNIKKKKKTVLSRQHVVAGHSKNDKEANNHKEGSLKSKESLTKNDKCGQ